MTDVACPPTAAVDRALELELIEVVQRVLQVPDSLRRFAVSPTGARRMYQLGPTVLTELVAAGLPWIGAAQSPLFDAYDLGNCALHLGLMSVQRRVMRSWARALTVVCTEPGLRYRVSVRASCPVPGHAAPCQYDVLLGDGRHRVAVSEPTDALLAAFDIAPVVRWPQLPDPVLELISTLDEIDFFLLPESIRWDQDFMWHTGMSDCAGIAQWLVNEGLRRGITVRFAFGLLVAKPFGTPHCWAEFLVDDTWVPVDPLLLRLLATSASLDPVAFPPTSSPGAILHRLTDHFTKIASHRGVWSPISLPVERVQ